MKRTYVSHEMAKLLEAKEYEFTKHTMRDGKYVPTATFQEVWEWLYDRGIFISVTPCYATEEEPYRWEVNKKQQGHCGGSATYYAREKYGDASSPEKALEQAIVWVLENMM